jgi:hypothetical protein
VLGTRDIFLDLHRLSIVLGAHGPVEHRRTVDNTGIPHAQSECPRASAPSGPLQERRFLRTTLNQSTENK